MASIAAVVRSMSSRTVLSYGGLLLAIYLVYRLIPMVRLSYRLRTNPDWKHIPSLPRHWLMGNLINAGQKLDPSLNRHPDYGMMEIWESLNRPHAWLLDLAPIDQGFLVVAHPDIAEAVVQPSTTFKYSANKSDTFKPLNALLGDESILTHEGEEWRTLRRRFNKGFSPAHLYSLSPLILSKMETYVSKLKAAAKSGIIFPMRDYAQDFTTEVIMQVAIEKDFGAQMTPEGQGEKSWPFGVLTALRMLSSLAFKIGQGFDPVRQFDPIRPAKEYFYKQVVDQRLHSIIRENLKNAGTQSLNVHAMNSGKSITNLALAGLEPTEALVTNTVDQLKTFLFAGQDTTSTTIQWMCYELSKATWNPQASTILTTLITEHNHVFGPDPFSALSALADPHTSETLLGDKLPYTTAFVKETLRLHPPASTARRIPWETTPPFCLEINGKETNLNGLRIYPSHYLIHRNPSIWGSDAAVFRPDRFLDNDYMNSLPVGSYRPFERGPRNCIGQNLAMMEAMVALCCLARGFEFEKIGLSGRDKEGDERELYSGHVVTSVPIDGTVMRVRLQKGVEG